MQPGPTKRPDDKEEASCSRMQETTSADHHNDDDDTECTFEAKKAKINSLDSDEEDEREIEKEKYNVANAETDRMFEGQENATIAFDGDTKITAFNMEEEMQEGHFDKEGTFIFRKTQDELKDSWLDNIDWVKVKEREEKAEELPTGLADPSSDSESEHDGGKDHSALHVKVIYSKMLEMMKPGENVLRCIRRLGGSGQGGVPRTGRRGKKLEPEQQRVLDTMVGCANDVLATGDMDIYQRTYEQLKFALAQNEGSTANLDMFADEGASPDISKDANPSTSTEGNQQQTRNTIEDKVMWEFKWDETDSANVYGPYSSEHMLAWTEQGYFGNGVYVRKKNEDKFYSSKRIDFDLYI